MHKRFFRIGQPKKSFFSSFQATKFPINMPSVNDFFQNYVQKNYTWISTKCLCTKSNDELLSTSDRYGVAYSCVICKSCGLIRGKKYLSETNVLDFYKNHYRRIFNKNLSAEELFISQKKDSHRKNNIINKYFDLKNGDKKIIVDVGGGAGGFLNTYLAKHDCILLDYYGPYIDYAKKIGIKCFKGSIKELNSMNIKPDLVVLSHVIEHWSNFNDEINELIKLVKKNETLVYVEFPGVDSIKLGRRYGDFLGDIHVPHLYYFASYVFDNIMERYGFSKKYLDSEIKAIYVYTGKINHLKNYYERVKFDLKMAEKTRRKQILKDLLKFFVPSFLLNLKKKFFGKNINFRDSNL